MAKTYKVAIWNQNNSSFDSTNESLIKNVIQDAIANNTNVLLVGGCTGCSQCDSVFRQISNTSNTINKDFLFKQELFLLTYHRSSNGSTKTTMKSYIDAAATAKGTSFTYVQHSGSSGGYSCHAVINMAQKKVYWVQAITSVSKSTITSILGDVPIKTFYTVTFKDWNGTTLKTQEVEKGASASPPSSPSRSGYEFTGWSPSYTNIQANTTCTAQYKQLEPEKDEGKRIVSNYCFGRKHDVTFMCSDGVSVYYLYPENQLYKSLGISISFNGNGASSGSQSKVQTRVRASWTCPSSSFSRSSFQFVAWNSKADGTGTTYTPGSSYIAPASDLTLYAQWRSVGKVYGVLAGYSQYSSQDSLNSVSVNALGNIVSQYSTNVTKLNGTAATPSAIKTAISNALAQPDCAFLYIFLCGHGERKTVSGKQCSYIAFKGGSLDGVALWDLLKDATCKVFVNIHTCHAGSFFKAVNPTTLSADAVASAGGHASDDLGEISADLSAEPFEEGDKADFIGDARQYFEELKEKRNSSGFFAAVASDALAAGEPKMLLWSSNKSTEYGWMVNSTERTGDPAWYAAYGEVGTGLEVSIKNNFSASKTYAKLWSDATKAGDASRMNQARVPGSTCYGDKRYDDGGPTPMKDVYGGFNENELVFTI